MSEKLNMLETKMLLKEFNYLISDIDFKNEFAMKYSKPFEVAIRQFLRERPFIKELCREKFGSLLDPDPEPKHNPDASGGSGESPEPEPIEFSDETSLVPFEGELIEDDDVLILEFDEVKMKKLYREVAQITHPDKVKSNVLNSLYQRASDANKRQDMLGIYSVCDELGIEFHVSQREIDSIRGTLKKLKGHQSTFERSHLWAWCENDYDEEKRKQIIQHFLLNHAPTVKGLFAT